MPERRFGITGAGSGSGGGTSGRDAACPEDLITRADAAATTGGGAGGGTSGGNKAGGAAGIWPMAMLGGGAGGRAARGRSVTGIGRGGNNGGAASRRRPNKPAKKQRERDGMPSVYRSGGPGSRMIVLRFPDKFASAIRSLPEVTDKPWREHAIDPAVRVRIVRPMPELRPSLEAEVGRLWQAAQARTSGLFNGRVFSADHLSPTLIEGHWTEYRRIIARIARPELADEMPVAPTAVGGVIIGGHGADRFVLFGRRPAGAVYQAGEWQLPPAGSLDPGAAEDDEVFPLRQLLAELFEELGLPGSAVREPRPLCLVEHPDSGVLDLGIALRTDWSAAAILDAHTQARDREYEPLEVVGVADLERFFTRHLGGVTRQTFSFLRCAGLVGPMQSQVFASAPNLRNP